MLLYYTPEHAQAPCSSGANLTHDIRFPILSDPVLFKQPYSKELIVNNGFSHPPIALTAAVNQETVRAVTGHKGGQQAGRQAGPSEN